MNWRLKQKIRIYNQYIGMDFDIEKYTMLIMKRIKREIIKAIDMPDPERIRTLGEKENYEYLGILEAHTIKTRVDERKNFF